MTVAYRNEGRQDSAALVREIQRRREVERMRLLADAPESAFDRVNVERTEELVTDLRRAS